MPATPPIHLYIPIYFFAEVADNFSNVSHRSIYIRTGCSVHSRSSASDGRFFAAAQLNRNNIIFIPNNLLIRKLEQKNTAPIMSAPSLLIESLVLDPRKSGAKSGTTAMQSPENAVVADRKRVCNPDHYNPTVREVNIPKLANGSCGFDLSRSKWDPYPWVSAIRIIKKRQKD